MSGKRKKLGKIDFKKFVDIFNTQGKGAAVTHVAEAYGVRYDTIVKRLKKESEYTYSQQRDRYILKSESNDESAFLSLDELCNSDNMKNSHIANTISSDEIIFHLIKDKFLEMSKFVMLESSSKKILLKVDAARTAGYIIEYH